MIMKKSLKVVLVAVLAVFAIEANAQFGIQAGYVNSVERFKNNGGKGTSDGMNGFKVGVSYDIAFPVKGLSIRPGLNYVYIGDKLADEESLGMTFKASRNEHYLNVPIDIKYAYGFSDNFKIYAFAGPKFAVGVASTVNGKFSGSLPLIGDISGSGSYDFYTGKVKLKGVADNADNAAEEFLDMGYKYSRFDVQLGVGVGVQVLQLLSVEFGYDWGLLNRVKDLPDNNYYKRNQLYVSLGLNF